MVTITTVFVISVLVLSSNGSASSLSEGGENPTSGAYVDKVVYRYISNPDTRILSLLAGDIDAIHGTFDPVHLDTLDMDPDIGVYSRPRNYYGHLLINCRDYPLNISGLRRAFAFAFDKTRVTEEVLNGHAIEHDSVVPKPNPWCIEDDLPWHYYTNQSNLGNQILDALNFSIDEGTGNRLAPDGTPFNIVLESWFEAGIDIAEIGVDALESLHIEAMSRWTSFNDLVPRLDHHLSYDMAIYASNFHSGYDVDWMEYKFGSEYADLPYYNPTNFVNESFDLWRDQLVNGTTYDEVFEASTMMQEILHENVPMLIVYEPIEYQAYRIDEFTGYAEDLSWGIAGPWTNLKVHNKTGSPFGGTFEVALESVPDTFNLFMTMGGSEDLILANLYSSLYKSGPGLVQYPDLAEDIMIETHATNTSVPEGRTMITVDIKSGATWSDGMPLTAEDVAFTFTYLYESLAYGNPAGLVLLDYLSSTTLSSHRARIMVDTESYWDIKEMFLIKILPKHVFNNETGVGYDGWNTWNPVFGSDPHVTCGPFYLSDHSTWTFELSRNLDYHWPSGTRPKVLSVEDITYIEGTTGNQIEWDVEDEDPLEYLIFQNGSLVEADDWNGSDIIHNVDGLSVGRYNYTLILSDTSGNMVANTVWVVVTPKENGEPQGLLVMGILGVSTVIIIAVGVVIHRRRVPK